MHLYNKSLASLTAGAILLIGATSCRLSPPPRASAEPFSKTSSYHGWSNAVFMSNGRVEAIVVPSIGRVMQFHFSGEEEGPFWENRALDGKAPNPTSSEWGNFGGDKSWPSPQSDWPKATGRAWPPPQAFDSMSVETAVQDNALLLTSKVDPHYGIRTSRRIELPAGTSSMRIITTYQKVAGPPQTLGVWIITQLRNPVMVYIPLPAPSKPGKGYEEQSKDLPAGLKNDSGLLSLTRDTTKSTKIGTHAEKLIWVGNSEVLTIEQQREAGRPYPDQGSSAEVYTNPDPLPYVELEMLGPLHEMKVGDAISQTNLYTLSKRAAADFKPR